MPSAILSVLSVTTSGQATAFAVALCVLTGLLTHFFWSWTRASKYPTGPAPWPLLGNMLYFSKVLKNADFELVPLAQKWGGLCMLWLGSQPALVISRLEDAREILDKKGASFSSRPKRNAFQQRVWPGLIVTQGVGEEFRLMRRVYNDLLGPNQSQVFKKYQDYESKITLKELYESPSEFMEHADRYAMSVIFSGVYGVRVGRLDHPVMVDLFSLWNEILSYFQPGTLIIDYLPFLEKLPESMQPWLKLADGLRARETRIHRGFLKKLKREVEAGTQLKCFGVGLVNLQEPYGIDDDTAINLFAGVILGGADTTSSMLQSFYKVMALNPKAQKEAQQEMDTVIGSARLPTWEDEPNLPYLRALIKEVHRWAPIMTLGLPHASSEVDSYKGRTIPDGTIVFPNLNVLQRDPERYDDPDSFKPERYFGDKLDAFTSAKHPDYLKRDHVHYGFGRRLCQGIHVAENSIFMQFSRVLWAFDIAPLEGEPPLDLTEKINGFITKPKPFKVSIKPRSEAVARVLLEAASTAETDILDVDSVEFGE